MIQAPVIRPMRRLSATGEYLGQETETKVFRFSKYDSTGKRIRVEKKMVKSEQEWTLPAPLGQLKTTKSGKRL